MYVIEPTPLIVGEAITDLLEKGFKPRRTLILSHGFDEEEVFARRGQGTIAPFLEKRYGNDGILMVIDEGSGNEDDVSPCQRVSLTKVLRRRFRYAQYGRERLYGHQGMFFSLHEA